MGLKDIAAAAEAERAEPSTLPRAVAEPPARTAPPTQARRGRPPKVKPEAPAPTRAQARIGKRALVGHFSPEMHKEVNRLAFDLDRTLQSIMGEALDDFLKKHKRPTYNER